LHPATDPNLLCPRLVEGVTKYPAGAKEAAIELWNSAVIRKAKALKAGSKLDVVVREGVGGRLGLWARPVGQGDFKMTMVSDPGKPQYRFIAFAGDVIDVEPVEFLEVEATKDPSYVRMFTDANLPVPVGPLAPVLYLITPDGILCTVRGRGTNKYPGGIWGVGGDIDDLRISVGEHLHKREDREEIELPVGAVIENVNAISLVCDNVLWKHDLVVVASTSARFGDIRKGSTYLPDVESVTCIPVGERQLGRLIVDSYIHRTTAADDSFWIGRPTPACSGGLLSVGKHLYGPGWLSEAMSRLV